MSRKKLYGLTKDIAAARRSDTGNKGMTAEQILRCAAFKQYLNLKNEELAFHLQDSNIFRVFAELYIGHDPSAPRCRKT